MTSFSAALAEIESDLAKAMPARGRLRANTDKPATTRTMDSDEFLAKALSAMTEGRISGIELGTIQRSISQKRQPKADLVKAVLTTGRITAEGIGGTVVAVEGSALNARDFMERAADLNEKGILRARDIATIEQCLNSGAPVPPALVRAVETGRKPDMFG